MLFYGVKGSPPIYPTHPRIITPFGQMVTHAVAGALDTERSVPGEQRVLSNGTEWRRWNTDSVIAEVLTGQYSPRLPVVKAVLGCQAIVWRVQAIHPVMGPAFSCRWRVLPAGADGGPDSGEGLDAQTWSIDKATLSLGTEDGQYLAARAKQGRHIPERLAPELDDSTVQYLSDGLRVPFSSLQSKELVQVHFIVAWTAADAADNADTWFAVEQSPSEILKQLGVS